MIHDLDCLTFSKSQCAGRRDRPLRRPADELSGLPHAPSGARLRTTKASGENRSTPIKNLERADGSIFLQGVEKGRAFSFAIEEDTGFATIAVARRGRGVTVFGACTTLNEGK